MSTVRFQYVQGYGTGLTLKLFPLNSDVQSNGAETSVEATNRKGLYSVTTAVANGQYVAQVYTDSTCVINGYVEVDSALDFCQIVDNFASAEGVDPPIDPRGPGAYSYIVTVNNSITDLPLAGADVWITTDIGGSNVIAGKLVTDSDGQVEFMLDLGTFYKWVQLSGYNFTNPEAITVAAP